MCILYCSDVHRILIMIWYGVWQQCLHNPLNVCARACECVRVCGKRAGRQAGDDQEFYLTIELSTDGYDVIMFAVLEYTPSEWVDLLMPIFLFVYCFCQFTFRSFARSFVHSFARVYSSHSLVCFRIFALFLSVCLFCFCSLLSRALIVIAHAHTDTMMLMIIISINIILLLVRRKTEIKVTNMKWCERDKHYRRGMSIQSQIVAVLALR